ncbi:hypothetical protein M1M96_00740 [Peptococcaceae bacterium]|nr:hypothetical protein [Peptococcaceae bacterium]
MLEILPPLSFVKCDNMIDIYYEVRKAVDGEIPDWVLREPPSWVIEGMRWTLLFIFAMIGGYLGTKAGNFIFNPHIGKEKRNSESDLNLTLQKIKEKEEKTKWKVISTLLFLPALGVGIAIMAPLVWFLSKFWEL